MRDQAVKSRRAPSRPADHPDEVLPDELRAAQERPGEGRQLLPEAGEEGDEVRDHPEEKVGGSAEERSQQEGGVHQGGGQGRPGLHRDPHGIRESPEHPREVAAGLSRLEAGGIDGREERIAARRGAHRHPGPNLGEDRLDRIPKGPVLHALHHDPERFCERQPGVQQGGEFLVEEQHLAAADRTPAAEEGGSSLGEAAQPGEQRDAPDREDVKPLALEFLAGGVGVPGGQPEPPQVARGFTDLAEEFGHGAGLGDGKRGRWCRAFFGT